jgi:hypothetical protein
MTVAKNLSSDVVQTIIETTDIGGTNTSTAWLSMRDYDRIHALVEIGTWDSGDDLDECRFQQASDSSGTGAKDLTTDASGGNYDTDNPVDADGNQVVLEARAEDLDVDNDFTHVRLYLAEAGNSGTDNVTAVVTRHAALFGKKALQGAASTGAQVYVTPNS